VQLHQHCHSLSHPLMSLRLLDSLRLHEFSPSSMAGWCQPESVSSITSVSTFCLSLPTCHFLPLDDFLLSLFPCPTPALSPCYPCFLAPLHHLMHYGPFLLLLLYIIYSSIYFVLLNKKFVQLEFLGVIDIFCPLIFVP